MRNRIVITVTLLAGAAFAVPSPASAVENCIPPRPRDQPDIERCHRGVARVAMLFGSVGLLLGPAHAEAAGPARHLLTRADLRGLHFGLTYGGASEERGCRVAAKYREAPHLDSNALENSVAFCRTVPAATRFYGDPLSAYDRCRPLHLRGMQKSTACLSSFGGGRLVIMRRGRRVAELSSDSPKVGGLSRRTLLRLARIQARRI